MASIVARAGRRHRHRFGTCRRLFIGRPNGRSLQSRYVREVLRDVACGVGTCTSVEDTPDCFPVCLDGTTVGRRCTGFAPQAMDDCAAQDKVCGQAWPEFNRAHCWPSCSVLTSPTCTGTVLSNCTPNVAGNTTASLVLVSQDCANEGKLCGVNPTTGQNDCIAGTPATNTMQETEFNGLLHPLFANRIWKSGLTVTGFISYGSAVTPLVPSLDPSDVDY